MALKFYSSVEKKVKTKSQKVIRTNSYFQKSQWGKLVAGIFAASPSSEYAALENTKRNDYYPSKQKQF